MWNGVSREIFWMLPVLYLSANGGDLVGLHGLRSYVFSDCNCAHNGCRATINTVALNKVWNSTPILIDWVLHLISIKIQGIWNLLFGYINDIWIYMYQYCWGLLFLCFLLYLFMWWMICFCFLIGGRAVHIIMIIWWVQWDLFLTL